VNVPNLLDQASVYPAPSIRLLHSSKINQQQKKKGKEKRRHNLKKKIPVVRRLLFSTQSVSDTLIVPSFGDV